MRSTRRSARPTGCCAAATSPRSCPSGSRRSGLATRGPAGVLLRREDLAAFVPEWVEPVRLRYRGLDVVTTPPNSQGVTALVMLNALAELDPPPPGTPGHVEALIAAKRVAFAARDRLVAD